MTATELNAEYIAENGPIEAGAGYTACVYCGSEEVCCGSVHDDCHCPACHKKDRAEAWGQWRDDDN